MYVVIYMRTKINVKICFHACMHIYIYVELLFFYIIVFTYIHVHISIIAYSRVYC